MGSLAHSMANLKLLFITLEYKAGTFSGNGVYSKSMVRSLAQLGHQVFVISGSPPDGWGSTHSSSTSNSNNQIKSTVSNQTISNSKDLETSLFEVQVPIWGRLDWKCGWKEFALNLSSDLISKVISFQPDWILAVDWSSIDVVSKLTSSEAWTRAGLNVPPMAYLNYRVYSISEYKGEEGDKEREFYRCRESQAVGMASTIAALSSRDAEYLSSELGQFKRKDVIPTALLPPLREDIRQISMEYKKARNSFKERKYLTCCVRLSPEKNATLFAFIVEKLSGFLTEQNIIPLLCTGANDPNSFSQKIIDDVKSFSADTVFIHGFMGPEKMAEIYSQTLLNVHPCIYDAYGMTVVESAAFGAPSLVHSSLHCDTVGNSDENVGYSNAMVGATELLSPSEDLIIPFDLTRGVDQIADFLKIVLLDLDRLTRVGKKAFLKSTSWDEKSNASKLTDILMSSPKRSN